MSRPLEGQGDGYQHSERIPGCKSFGIWPLSQAAEACFGTAQVGYELLHPPREEPWGQTVARLQSPEGAIIGISYAPVLHE